MLEGPALQRGATPGQVVLNGKGKHAKQVIESKPVISAEGLADPSLSLRP